MDDTFLTVARPGSSELKDRGSRFIALAVEVRSEHDVAKVLAGVRKEMHDARHHCYAYRLGRSAEVYRSNDDGEPSGTAGAPILQQIESRELTNALVVVTRYFGGTKLGRGGLARAYSDCAARALDAAGTRRRVVLMPVLVQFEYDDTATAMRVIESVEGRIVRSEYSEITELTVEVRRSEVDGFCALFTNELAGRGEVTPVVD